MILIVSCLYVRFRSIAGLHQPGTLGRYIIIRGYVPPINIYYILQAAPDITRDFGFAPQLGRVPAAHSVCRKNHQDFWPKFMFSNTVTIEELTV